MSGSSVLRVGRPETIAEYGKRDDFVSLEFCRIRLTALAIVPDPPARHPRFEDCGSESKNLGLTFALSCTPGGVDPLIGVL